MHLHYIIVHAVPTMACSTSLMSSTGHKGQLSSHDGQLSSLHGQDSGHNGQISGHSGQVSSHKGQVSSHSGQSSNIDGQILADSIVEWRRSYDPRQPITHEHDAVTVATDSISVKCLDETVPCIQQQHCVVPPQHSASVVTDGTDVDCTGDCVTSEKQHSAAVGESAQWHSAVVNAEQRHSAMLDNSQVAATHWSTKDTTTATGATSGSPERDWVPSAMLCRDDCAAVPVLCLSDRPTAHYDDEEDNDSRRDLMLSSVHLIPLIAAAPPLYPCIEPVYVDIGMAMDHVAMTTEMIDIAGGVWPPPVQYEYEYCTHSATSSASTTACTATSTSTNGSTANSTTSTNSSTASTTSSNTATSAASRIATTTASSSTSSTNSIVAVEPVTTWQCADAGEMVVSVSGRVDADELASGVDREGEEAELAAAASSQRPDVVSSNIPRASQAHHSSDEDEDSNELHTPPPAAVSAGSALPPASTH